MPYEYDALTFSSRNVAAVSTHSLNELNQLLFDSAFSTIVRISFSLPSRTIRSFAKLDMDVVVDEWDKVSCIRESLRRAIAVSREGRGAGSGTRKFRQHSPR